MSQEPAAREAHASDRPIISGDQDGFQRAPFAERISTLLLHRKSTTSIVIGLYGKWGEGKSSVLNLIHQTVKKDSQAVVIEFNPWLFSDEEQMIIGFFGLLAQALDQGKRFAPWQEKAAKTLVKYIMPMVPKISIGGVSSDPGQSITTFVKSLIPDTKKLKKRIEDLIEDSGRRVIVMVDDIDRLDKKQIQSLFRLVKLTADFKHTAYLLAFDDVMVAKAIGEMFEQGGEEAGQNFLEKIIQIPLRLPRAHPDALGRFLFDRVNEVLAELQLVLAEDEVRRYNSAISYGVLPYLNTPRLAIRYANAIHFALPLLQGEANDVDVMLVEALKVFYPNLYRFVARQGHHIAGGVDPEPGYNNSYQQAEGERIRSSINAAVEEYGENASTALALLSSMFPRVRRAFDKGPSFLSYQERTADTNAALTAKQSVASWTYFDRYFGYSVISGQIPDQQIFHILNLLVAGEEQAAFDTANRLLDQYGASKFIDKIETRILGLKPEAVSPLLALLIQMHHMYSVPAVVKPLLRLLTQLPTGEGRLEACLNIINTTTNLEYGRELIRLIQDGRHDTEPVSDSSPVDATQFRLIVQALLSRALREAGERPLYHVFPSLTGYLLYRAWRIVESGHSAVNYLKSHFATRPHEIQDLLLVIFGPHLIGRDDVRNLAEHLGGSYLYSVARQVLGNEEVTENPGILDERSSPENLLRQFVYLYEHFVDPERRQE